MYQILVFENTKRWINCHHCAKNKICKDFYKHFEELDAKLANKLQRNDLKESRVSLKINN